MLALAYSVHGNPYFTDQPVEGAAFTLPTPPTTDKRGRSTDYLKLVKGVSLKQPVTAIKGQCKAKLQPAWEAHRAARRAGGGVDAPEIVETLKEALQAVGDAWGSHREKGLVIECVEQADAKQLLRADLLEAVVIGDIDLVCDLFEEGGSRVAAYSRKHRPGGFDLIAMTEDDALRMRESFGAYCVILAGVCTSTAEHVQRLFQAVCPVVICC